MDTTHDMVWIPDTTVRMGNNHHHYGEEAPAGACPVTGDGLLAKIGNVWERTTSAHGEPAASGEPASTHFGHAGQAMPARADLERVIKGSSVLSATSYRRHHRPAARNLPEIDSSTCHIGFRCVRRTPCPEAPV